MTATPTSLLFAQRGSVPTLRCPTPGCLATYKVATEDVEWRLVHCVTGPCLELGWHCLRCNTFSLLALIHRPYAAPNALIRNVVPVELMSGALPFTKEALEYTLNLWTKTRDYQDSGATYGAGPGFN